MVLGEELHGDATDVGRAQDVGEVEFLGRRLRKGRRAARRQDSGHAGGTRNQRLPAVDFDQRRFGGCHTCLLDPLVRHWVCQL